MADNVQTPLQTLAQLCRLTLISTYAGQRPDLADSAAVQVELEKYASGLYVDYEATPYIPNVGDVAAADDLVAKYVACYEKWVAKGKPWPLPARTAI